MSDTWEPLAGEPQGLYDADDALEAWGLAPEVLWARLSDLERIVPEHGRVVAGMVEPATGGQVRPILAVLRRDSGTGAVTHVANMMWGPLTRDVQQAAAAAAAMHAQAYDGGRRLVVLKDAGDAHASMSWRETAEFAVGIEQSANAADGGTVGRRRLLGVAFEESRGGAAPCFVLSAIDPHGQAEEFGRLAMQECRGFDGEVAGWATPDSWSFVTMCTMAFEAHEERAAEAAASLCYRISAVIDTGLASADTARSWLECPAQRDVAAGTGDVAAEIGAEGIEDGRRRSWLTDIKKSPLCHRPRVVVSDADGDRSIKVETVGGNGMFRFGLDLRATFDARGAAVGRQWTMRRAQPPAPERQLTAAEREAFEWQGHNHDVDEVLGVGHVCGACEHMSHPPEPAALGGDGPWRPTIGGGGPVGLEDDGLGL